MPALVQTLTVPCDLTGNAIFDACGLLGIKPADGVLYCSTHAAGDAQKIEDALRCKVILLPIDMLKTRFTWAFGDGRNFVWSPGIP